MRKTSFYLLSLYVAFFAMSCEASDYKGDGTFVDYGASAASWRYILTLGETELNTKGSEKYQLVGLPSEKYFLGVAIGREGMWAVSDVPDTRLGYRLVDGNGSVVVQEDLPLAEWTWSIQGNNDRAFVYVDNANNSFRAVSGETYTLIILVQPSATSSDRKLVGKFELRVQGWK